MADDWLLFHSLIRDLDFALVRRAERPGDDRGKGWVRGYMEPVDYEFERDEPLHILQHSDAGPVTYISGSVLQPKAADRVTYNANTEPGSSGSPCMTMELDVVALHCEGFPDYNRGVRFAPILKLLKANQSRLRQRGLVGVLGLDP